MRDMFLVARLLAAPGGRAAGATMLLLGLLLAAPAARAAGWPVLDTAAPARGGGEKDAALVVGVEKYADVPGVEGALANADAWYAHLTRTLGVPVGSVTLLRDREVTVEKLRKYAAEAASRVKPGGTLWFVFVGHGAPAKDGKDGILVGYDAQQDADSLYARSVPQQELLGILGKGPQARTVAILDACFSGRSGAGAPLVPGLQPLLPVSSRAAGGNTLVFTAGKADQFAGPLPGASRPAFSYLFLGALRGWAAGGDGVVTADEAVSYVRDALRVTVKDRTQTPELVGAGNAVIATPATEPGPDLAALVLARPALAALPGGKVQVTGYAICERRVGPGRYEPIPTCTEARLDVGDRVKLAVEVDRPARVYLFNVNAGGAFQTLFPEPGLENELPPGRKIFLPEGDEWLEIDEAGRGSTECVRIFATEGKEPALEVLRGLTLPAGSNHPLPSPLGEPCGGAASEGRKARLFKVKKPVAVSLGASSAQAAPVEGLSFVELPLARK